MDEDDEVFSVDDDVWDSVIPRAAIKSFSDPEDDYSLTDKEHMDRIVEACAMSRVWFAENVLEVELADWQHDVLSALDEGDLRISVRSGNGVGKTMLCALIIIHFVLFRTDVKVPVTAPSSSQLRDGLHPECIKWIKALPPFLKEQLGYTQDRIVRIDNPENNFVSFRTARKETPEALAGIHAAHVMAVVDEASAVDDVVFESAQGTLSTPGSIFIMIGNPTRLSGYFFNSHHRLKHMWSTFHVSSFEALSVDVSFVETIESTYGLDSNQYRVRVKGEFPTGDEDALISRSTVLSAVGRDITGTSDEVIWGVDPGRGGDNTGFAARKGNLLTEADEWSQKDLMKTVGVVHEKWKECVPNTKPDRIYVDSIGIGAGVADRLRELGLPVIDVNVSETSSLTAKFNKLRPELWYGLKEWLESLTCCIKISEKLTKEMSEVIVEEVSTPIAVYTSLGKNDVESKPQMRSRGVKSPNVADAICLTFAGGGAIMAGRGGGKGTNWNKPLDYTPPHVH